MVYAYIRVSTDKQTVENQRYEIGRFCEGKGMEIDKWVSETASGTKAAGARKLGALLRRMKRGDTLVCSEISRLGRRLMEVMGILNTLMTRQVVVLTVKERYELGNNIQSQILAFAFSLSAQGQGTAHSDDAGAGLQQGGDVQAAALQREDAGGAYEKNVASALTVG